MSYGFLEQTELLLSGTEDLVLLKLQHVETHGLAERTALTASDDITFLGFEAGTERNDSSRCVERSKPKS